MGEIGSWSTVNIEMWGVDANDWTSVGLVRYRSRRDLLEVLPATFGSQHHGFKHAALKKTLAFPVDSWNIMGGPRLVVALALALLAALTQIIFL